MTERQTLSRIELLPQLKIIPYVRYNEQMNVTEYKKIIRHVCKIIIKAFPFCDLPEYFPTKATPISKHFPQLSN